MESIFIVLNYLFLNLFWSNWANWVEVTWLYWYYRLTPMPTSLQVSRQIDSELELIIILTILHEECFKACHFWWNDNMMGRQGGSWMIVRKKGFVVEPGFCRYVRQIHLDRLQESSHAILRERGPLATKHLLIGLTICFATHLRF